MSSPAFSREEAAGSLKPIEQASWLPQRAYVDKEIYKEEMRVIFSKEWIAIFHHTSLANTGDYRSMDVAGRPLLFVRDEGGRIRCYINICRHRGMAIAQGEGHCKGFVCPYHTWAYDLDGRVINRPLIDGKDVREKDIRLTEVRAEIFLGFVFINFDKDAQPVATRYQSIAKELAPWGDADLEVMFESTFPCKWNWKLMIENASEAYHVAGIHGTSAEAEIPTRLAYVTAPQPSTHAVIHTPYAKNAVFKPPQTTDEIVTIPNLPSWVNDEIRFYCTWPCALLWSRKDFLVGYFVVPGDGITDHKVMTMVAVPKEAKNNPNFEAYRKAWKEYLDLIQLEDESPCGRIQRSYEGCQEWIPGPYAASEGVCHHFHQWYLTKMGVG
jgi:phenylpropionate dioxygenase-like ring-hydroxylating dioxygenase large terminal subunit